MPNDGSTVVSTTEAYKLVISVCGPQERASSSEPEKERMYRARFSSYDQTKQFTSTKFPNRVVDNSKNASRTPTVDISYLTLPFSSGWRRSDSRQSVFLYASGVSYQIKKTDLKFRKADKDNLKHEI